MTHGRNEISGGSIDGPAVQAGSIGSVHFGTRPHGTSSDRLVQVKSRLAEEVRRQWREEAKAQELDSPAPLRLWWRRTERAVAARGADGARQRGAVDGLVAMFRELPVKQLMILGERASGKSVSMMLLTLGLLEAYDPADPVPVLMTASSWHPRREHLHTWLARRLVQEHPFLADRKECGRDMAARLVTGGHVLLMLDGLDELPSELHGFAIRELDKTAGGEDRLVVTCLAAEYEEAVVRSGRILTRATVVEMEPVTIDRAEEFLTADRPSADRRWQDVLARLRAHPDYPAVPLAQALTSPLMIALARAIYAPAIAEPGVLLGFCDQKGIEDHLLSAFLPAAYEPRPSSPGAGRGAQARYRPERACQWLAFAARHMNRTRTQDFAWWQVATAVPGSVRGLVFGILSGLMFGLIGNAAGGPVNGFIFGVPFALAGFLVQTTARCMPPTRVEIGFRGTGGPFLLRSAVGFTTGLALGFGHELPHDKVLMLGALFALAFGLHAWLRVPVDAKKVSSPGLTLQQDRTATLMLGLSFALSFGFTFGTVFAYTDPWASRWPELVPVNGLSVNLVFAFPGVLAGWTGGRLSYGRVGSLAYGAAGAILSGIIFPPADDPGFAYGLGIAFGLACGFVVVLGRPWGAFVFACALLALSGRLPWRPMAFLQGARLRGVLRQAGGVHQFRHARLRDHLAEGRAGRFRA
ncbi:hypothetical protein [Streptomyces luteireticuli]|uniref:hypothetical protein n=1 Tax=Streptomyces luteireticuli TaxID=173858 RepID=UPI0035563CEC